MGVLFKSANYRTWTPEQMEDLKFTLRKAVFDTSASDTLTLANKTLPVKTLEQIQLEHLTALSLIRIFHKNHFYPFY